MDDLALPRLYDYAVWANDRVLTTAAALTDTQWRRAMGHSFGSVHATMVHVLSSEALWLARWQGESPRERSITPEGLPTLAALQARWTEVSAALRAYVGPLDGTGWRQEIHYTTLDGRPAAYPLWQMFLQVINHGTHHRAEAAAMLTQLGHPPPPLDLIEFFREHR
jgi:uncharacterized damage-inducible protein DinB